MAYVLILHFKMELKSLNDRERNQTYVWMSNNALVTVSYAVNFNNIMAKLDKDNKDEQ